MIVALPVIKSIRLCPKSVRDIFPGHDLVLKCTDGNVKVHMNIMILQSIAIKDIVVDCGLFDEYPIIYNASLVERALDYIYGCVCNTYTESNSRYIPVELYDVFSCLQVDHLLDSKYYHIHDIKLDIVSKIDHQDNDLLNAILDWMINVDTMRYPSKLVQDTKADICKTLCKISFHSGCYDKLANADFDTLKVLFENINDLLLGNDWRPIFLATYMMTKFAGDELDKVKNILLPRTSMVLALHANPDLAAVFGLTADYDTLIEHQIRCCYFYNDDLIFKYKGDCHILYVYS